MQVRQLMIVDLQSGVGMGVYLCLSMVCGITLMLDVKDEYDLIKNAWTMQNVYPYL